MHELAVAALGMAVAVVAAPWLGEVAAPAPVLLLCGLWLLRAGPRRVGFALLGAALGLLAVASLPQGPRLHGLVSLEGVVIGAPSGRSADVAVSRVATVDGPWTPMAGRVRVRFPERAPAPGTPVLVRGRAGPPGGLVLPGEPDPVRNAARAGVRTEVRAQGWARLGGAVGREDRFGEVPHGGVLRALTSGDRDGVTEETWTLLRRTGTAHLLAISGFHVGLVALIAGGLVALGLRLVALVRHEGVPMWPAWVVGALAGVLYAWSAGAPVSAQRAAAVVALASLARAAHRPVEPMGLLGLAALAVLAVDPAAIGTASFQLSFGAVVGLLRVTPWLLRWLPPDLPSPLTWTARGVAATLGATAGTFPAAAWWFQELAVLSPLANLVALPWVAFLVVPCAAVGAWGPDPVGGWAVVAGSWAVAGLLAVLDLLAVEPLRPAVGPLGALLLAAALLGPARLAPLPLALALWTALPPRPPDALVVTFLQVGQGDAALVEHPCGRRWLVDGGPPSDRVAKYLRRRGIRHLDLVVSSHGHDDHTGGLPAVLDGLRVDALWLPAGEGHRALLEAALRRGTVIHLRPEEALHPPLGFEGRNLNDRSLVITAEHAGWRVLFTGDVERAGEAELLGALPDRVAVLKVPHHGSRTSSAPELLDALAPRLAVAGIGRDSRFGHPHLETVARYRERRVPFLRTDRDGTVEVTVHPDVLWVRTWQAGRGFGGAWVLPLAERTARR